MKTIPLTQNKEAIVSDRDFKELSKYKWHVTAQGYAGRGKVIDGKRTVVLMHREIKQGKEIDHINCDRLDNRRSNLRISTRSQNMANTPIRSTNTSGYKGVSWSKSNKKWYSYICIEGKTKCIGHFTDKLEAAKAYNLEARKYFGNFARLNNV